MLSPDYASDVSDDGTATESTEEPKYKCMYCPKLFSKTQALGGHQNAHRRERDNTKRRALLECMNLLGPNSYPYPYPYPNPFPNQHALPPGFEIPRFKNDGPSDLAMVYNQCTRYSSSDFARLQVDPSQRMDQGWAITADPYQPVMAQHQPQPLLSTSSPICLDLCLGVGNSSQTQTQAKEPNNAMEMVAEKEDDDLSLTLSL
ncbi:unnamed protein product [Microthlaspi erraticum]|uniref:C2H2-type domain-containing protein n=1 Tax=Microthlaspi erraticum TaxID=1685480 RepID=A0A6D2J1W3_9BRAS|nr:unnamed protein product [Microthlaspi erraticum]